MISVKNIKGTGENFPNPSCGCSKWIEHWENKKHILARKCRCCKLDYNHNDLVGGHVKKTSSYDGGYYIVPLCKSCNNYRNVGPFYVNEEDLVPVNSNCN